MSASIWVLKKLVYRLSKNPPINYNFFEPSNGHVNSQGVGISILGRKRRLNLVPSHHSSKSQKDFG